MSDHQHYEGCYRHHFVCAQERIRDLEKENRRLIDERIVSALVHHEMRERNATFAGYRPPVYLGNPDLPHPPRYTTSPAVIPCGDAHFTHFGDEPPSATP